MGSQRLARPDGANLSRGVVTDRKYEVEVWRIGSGKLIPRLRVRIRHIEVRIAKHLYGKGMHISGRLTSSAKPLELPTTKPVQDGLCHDRPRRISGAEEKHVQGFLAAYDFHNALP
jgi:hypothetical protein